MLRYTRFIRLFFICSISAAALAQAQTAPISVVDNIPPQQFAQLGTVRLESGQKIDDCALGYRTLGTLNADKSNAILFPTWFTGKSAEVLPMLGKHGLFDATPYFVIIVDAPGNGVSCSPSNSQSQHGTAFPRFTISDMVEMEHRFLQEKFGIKHLHAVIGHSMGGMQTFQWMVSYPNFMNVAIPISGTPRQSSFDMLLWRTEELAILSDPEYSNGNYKKNPRLSLFQLIFALNLDTPAFRLAHTNPSNFEKFFEENSADDPNGPDANDVRWQIHAMLAQDIGVKITPNNMNGSMELAAQKVQARVRIINGIQDHIVNPTAAIDFARLLHADATILQGDCGHFAINCEIKLVRPVIDAMLKLN